MHPSLKSPPIQVGPFATARGEVTLPGSKSISNRTLLLAALSEGTTTILNLLKSDDTQVMLAALTTLGVGVTITGEGEYRVVGCAGRLPVKDASIFLGNAGTAARSLTAALAFSDGRYELHGVARMHERPIGDLVDALHALGAAVSYRENPGFPPLSIAPFAAANTAAVTIRGDVSSQFLSALLMALPLYGQAVTVDIVGELISKPYVEITLNLMRRFGVEVVRDGWSRFRVAAGARYVSPGQICVEGDASSASYFLAAGAIAGCVRVHGVGRDSIQGDVRFAETLEQMGAVVRMGADWLEVARPTGGRLRALDADLNHIPDAAMTIAICALFADGVTTIRNIASWRVKETDRISAMATELRKVGADVVEGTGFIQISPPSQIHPAVIDTYDDHRMAMCFSLAAFGGAPITINDPNCVAKTFPDYFSVFSTVAT